jgi:parvulin-like peptidyl-prolyl isomerase
MNKIYPAIRDSEAAFEQAAKFQVSPSLAAAGGHIKPVGHNTTGNPELEAALFNLKQGQISTVMDMPEGLVVVKCLKHIEPNTSVSFDACKADLEKDVFDRKVSLEVTKMFQELYTQAKPTNLLEQSGGVDDLNQMYGPMKTAVAPFPTAPAPASGFNTTGG